MNGLGTMQQFLSANHYDGAILQNPTNLRYFAGFTGTTAVVLITPKSAYLLTDSRYTEQAQQQCENYEVIQYTKDIYETMGDLLDESHQPLENCIFEGDLMSVDTYMKMADALPDTDFLSCSMASLRIIKRPDEVVKLKEAFRIADEAFAAMLPQLKVGMSENEARRILEVEMLMRGSSEPSFTTIVASGTRSSMPHGVASDKIMERGDFVTFDFGAMYEGYHSDMTRTIVLGKASELQKKLYDIVLTAQSRGVAAVRPGLTGVELDAVCRDYIRDAGYGEYFGHGTGHGVGLDIHELPVASPRSEDRLEEGMVVTIEPGVYLPNQLGLRIEDTVLVTSDGCEVLTRTSKDLIELDV